MDEKQKNWQEFELYGAIRAYLAYKGYELSEELGDEHIQRLRNRAKGNSARRI